MSTARRVDAVVVGGGIVGLATARALQQQQPGIEVVVLEKESRPAFHQTGRNSGVIHSGIYYKPGGLKASLCRRGGAELVEFCREQGIPHEVCGKVIVATDPTELPRLATLAERAKSNGIEAELLGPAGIKDHEPHVAGIAGLWVPSTGIVDYALVVDALARLVRADGGDLRLGAEVTKTSWDGRSHHVWSSGERFQTQALVNCAGLQSDRVARLTGATTTARIVPFRGEYYELVPSRRSLVRNLVYPVPDPSFPFLGVHFTRMIDGSVHAGPNAVLALKREGYRRRDINARDVWDTLSYPGFWRLARRHYRPGTAEVARSLSKRLFVRSLRRLVPAVDGRDLVPAGSGVRAQALEPDGALVDDFLFVERDGAVHVCNAPSPAATSSLAIGGIVAAHAARIMAPVSTPPRTRRPAPV